MRNKIAAFLLAAGLLTGAALVPATAQASNETAKHVASNKSGSHGGKPAPILYHGGPVILGTTNTYVIWYGTWPASSTQPILTDLLSNVGGSPYFNINTTYYDGSGSHVSNSVHYAGSTVVSAPSGSTVDQYSVVSGAINSGALPLDPNGVYFVLGSADIKANGFLTSWCGWHTQGNINGTAVKYAYVEDPSNGMSACAAQTVSPNGNAPADAMGSVVTHELEESVTDPLLNAWYDRQGNENADKCAWTFGATHTAVNGSKYNLTLGSRNYLIQQNWVNQGNGFCALSY